MRARPTRSHVVIDEQRRTVTTRFADGAVLVAAPVDDAESRAHASALGYRGADAVWAMTRDHDLLHTLLAEARGLPHSPTLHAVATGKPVDPAVADDEERIVFLLARAMNTGVAGNAHESCV